MYFNKLLVRNTVFLEEVFLLLVFFCLCYVYHKNKASLKISIHSLFTFLSDFICSSDRAPIVNFPSSALPVTINNTANTIFFSRFFLSLHLYLVFVRLHLFVPWKHPGSLLIENVNGELLYGKLVTSVNKLKRTVLPCNGRQ